MTITNMANVYPIPARLKNPVIEPVYVDNFRSTMKSNTDAIDLAENKKMMSFEQMLLQFFDDMNSQQIKTQKLGKQMLVDPESVDVHDVTITMAKASMSLSIAQAVIDRLIKSWNDITTTR